LESRVGLGYPYLGLAAGELAPDTLMAAPRRSVSLATAMPIHGSFDAADQGRSSERLREEANGPGLQRAGADALIGEGVMKISGAL